MYTGLHVELPEDVRPPLATIEDCNDTDEEPRSPETVRKSTASTPSRTPSRSDASLTTPTKAVGKLASLRLGGSAGKAKDGARHSRTATLW